MLKRNITANFASQTYVSAVGILVIPLYLAILGPEAYGLIGFFTVLQVVFNQLDLGLSQTMARETARHGAGGDTLTFRKLARAVQSLFLAISLSVGGTLFVGAGAIADHWLQNGALARSEVVFAIQVMALALAARWFSGLHRGIIIGAERQVWLSGFNAIVGSFRHILVVGILLGLGETVTVFFAYQAVLAVAELGVLILKARKIVPNPPVGEPIGWSLRPLGPVLKFSLGLSFTSLVWVGITYTDKLVLSAVLPLAEYGAYSIAILLANGVILATTPIGMAVRPRFARLEATGDPEAFMRLYRKATQLVCIMASAVSWTLVFFAQDFLEAWTGSIEVTRSATPIVQLYALGNGLLAMTAMPYYLQFAKGDLKLHVRGNIAFAVIIIPAMIVAATEFGAIGAAWTWAVVNAGFFAIWTAVIHNHFAPGTHTQWVRVDVVPIFVSVAFVVLACHWMVPAASGRDATLLTVGLSGLAALATAIGASSEARQRIQAVLRQKQAQRLP